MQVSGSDPLQKDTDGLVRCIILRIEASLVMANLAVMSRTESLPRLCRSIHGSFYEYSKTLSGTLLLFRLILH